MPSLFADTDKVICSALGIQRREQLMKRALVEPLSDETAACLVNGLYERMAGGGAWSMSLEARAFPEAFDRVPFPDGKTLKAECRTDGLTVEGRTVRDAFFRSAPV